MKTSLVICTYKRHLSMNRLLGSIKKITDRPYEIVIIDASPDINTKDIVSQYTSVFDNITYYKCKEEERGLTKQRNLSLTKINQSVDIVAFVDDDVEILEGYFKNIEAVYENNEDCIGVGGYEINYSKWRIDKGYKSTSFEICQNVVKYDGYFRKVDLRLRVRSIFNLLPYNKPGIVNSFSHGYSLGMIPPSGKVYEVNYLKGCCMSFKKDVFKHIQFSNHFVGYGLYEDWDFSFRALKYGKLYLNTSSQLNHYHDIKGRPNMFKYGSMVSINGWYVWRLSNQNPVMIDRIKWLLTSILLIIILFKKIINVNTIKSAITEIFGRTYGLLKLIIIRPNIKY